MIKVLFVCHGNICRSTMAEFVFADMVKKTGMQDKFHISSAATSTEEIGRPPHHGTIQKLNKEGIPYYDHRATQVKRKDYDAYDYILTMEDRNIKNMRRIIPSDPEDKIHNLLDYTDSPRDIADPWYTGNFDATYNDIVEGLTGFLDCLKQNHLL